MNFIDISWAISEQTTAYKNKKTITITQTKQFETDNARESVLSLNVHSGTHIDAPSHFVKDGVSIDQTPLTNTVGPCTVLDMQYVTESIKDTDLADLPITPGSIILFKTKNSALDATALFDPNFIFLHESGARHLADKKVKTVGIDYLGIERGQPGHPTHKALLQNGITIIEGLRLGDAQPGSYFLYCLPLALIGTDAAPARALLQTP